MKVQIALLSLTVIICSCTANSVKNKSDLEKMDPEKYFISGESSLKYREILKSADLIETNDNRIEYCFGDCRKGPQEGEGENYKVIVDIRSLKILYIRLRPDF